MMPPKGLSWVAMDPEDPLPYKTSHQLLGELPAAAVDELLAAAGPGSESPLAAVELRHLGGALARSAPHHGAYGAIDAEYLMFAVGAILAPEHLSVIEAAVDRVAQALAPWSSGVYPNFIEESFDLSSAFDAGAGDGCAGSGRPSIRKGCSWPTTRSRSARGRV